MSSNKGLALGFEFLDIEIIDHKKESGMSNGKWNCDECSLFFLSKDKLSEHKNKHLAASQAFKCQYCNKSLPVKSGYKESYAIRKCNTCEYKCTKCPLRFQRHSSLVNHGKTHLQKKKKCSVIKRKSHVIKPESENVANKKTRKRKTEKVVSDQPTNIEKNGHDNVTVSLIPKKKRRTLPSQIHDEKLVPCDSNDHIKTKKQSVSTINETLDTKVHTENKQNQSGPTDSGTTSLHDSIVNYKPFSCHVCGDNFASGESLLQHIQSHGENVSQGFKCKHCGDAFEDIYKMQYHLAICPLAEDETSLVKNIAVRLHTAASTGSPRKKGRPKKIKTERLSESSSYDLTPSLSTRGSMKRRNTENKPERSLENEFVDSNCEGIESVGVDNIEEDPLGGVDVASKNVNHSSIVSCETVPEDVTKVHSCPFPRCGIKFSREKALLCHMRNHSDVFEDSFKCHKCDIPFDDIHSLRIHLNECKDIKEENDDNLSEPDYADEYNTTDKASHTFQRKKGDHKCNTCGKVFASQEKLKRHLALHGSSNFICRICKDVFINQQLLDDHFLSKHPLKSSYHCEICNEDFISELFLTIHESEYHGESNSSQLTNPTNVDGSELLKSGTVSMKGIKRLSYCSSVMGSRYKDKSCFWCPICLTSFDKKESMRTHFSTDHIVVSGSVYTCEVCNTEKPNAEMMGYHLEMHSENMLSVNRFSILRAFINEKGSKMNEIIKKKSKVFIQLKNDSNSVSVENKDSKLINEIIKTKSKVTQKKLETHNKTQKTQSNKVNLRLKGMPIKQPHASLPKQHDDELLASMSQPRNLSSNPIKLRRYKCTRNGDGSKLKIATVVKRSKIKSNRIVSLARRKRRKPHKKQENVISIGDKERSNEDFNTNSSACNFITKDLADNNSESINRNKNENSSSRNTLDNDMLTEESLPSANKNKRNSSPSVNTGENQTECPKDEALANTPANIDSDSSSETEEEICCSMCSMSFFHQDELLDHVATHI